jgi:peptidoglycan hydrolase CwlO-like protein
MAHRLLWAVAIMLATLALVAGCVNVSVPKGPYVVAGQPRPPSPQARQQVQAMDKQALENEVLRLVGENDSLRQKLDEQKRENKVLKDRGDRLEDQIKDMRKR